VSQPRAGEAARSAGSSKLEPGSYRDPDSRVFYAESGVFRLLSERGLRDWEALARSSLWAEGSSEGKLIATEPAPDRPVLSDALHEGVAAVLRHELIPFVSYPYEWPFGMLKDAALLQLELLRRALAEDLILKDSSPYNVQWRGSEPVFVDIGSFERLRPGEPWAGYRQFCMLYLNPLLLQAYKNVPFQPWLRGSIGGIAPEECAKLMSVRDRLRRGVLTHVVLHARLDRGQRDSARDIRKELRTAGFRKELILANVRRLERLVRRLEWTPPASAWSGYGATTTYTPEDAERKTAFVRAATASRRWGLVWDLGSNVGRYSRILAESASYVVAADADTAVVEALYRSLKQEGNRTILPLAVDVTDPSPALGWNSAERRTLAGRGAPDLVVCLALIHHVSIVGNVPVGEFLDWLRGLGSALLIEFPTREDTMVQRLLARKRERSHPDYDRAWFERALADRFDVERTEELSSGRRVLYFGTPKG